MLMHFINLLLKSVIHASNQEKMNKDMNIFFFVIFFKHPMVAVDFWVLCDCSQGYLGKKDYLMTEYPQQQ